ncbi:MAG: TlpA disulfide reductase family protein, partial [Gordonia sp. (in: high G+C Gram-positive bacteria)]
SDSELAEARAAAALAPCPDDAAAPGPTAALRDVSANCLGDGRRIDLGPATGGKPLVVNFWAVWCLPCRNELPHFDKLRQRAGDRLNVLGVHAYDGAGRPFLILKFLQEVGVHLPVVTDDDGKIAEALGAPRIYPSTVLIRADGTVAKVLPQVFDSAEDLEVAVRDGLGVDLGGSR